MTMATWMRANLETQGYCLSEGESQALRVGLRFPTAVCLALVATGLVLQSAAFLAALVVVAAFAGWTSRHPFDYLWNHGVRHLAHAPALPANPPRRRHAFKLATFWLAGVAVLFATGHPVAAAGLAAPMLAVCALVTVTNFCVPSTLLALVEGRGRRYRAESIPPVG
jgi:Domain of unknown function (DUF4395)